VSVDLEALKRLTPRVITALGRGDSIRAMLVPADRWPAILAALEEREGLRQRVTALEIALRDTDTQLWAWTKGHPTDGDREWRPLSVREQHRVNGLLLGPLDGAAREAEEASGGR